MKKLFVILLAVTAVLLIAVAVRPPIIVAQTGGEPPPLISQVAVTPFGDQTAQSLESAEERVYLECQLQDSGTDLGGCST